MNTLAFDGKRIETVLFCFKNRRHAVCWVSILKANPGAFRGQREWLHGTVSGGMVFGPTASESCAYYECGFLAEASCQTQ